VPLRAFLAAVIQQALSSLKAGTVRVIEGAMGHGVLNQLAMLMSTIAMMHPKSKPHVNVISVQAEEETSTVAGIIAAT